MISQITIHFSCDMISSSINQSPFSSIYLAMYFFSLRRFQDLMTFELTFCIPWFKWMKCHSITVCSFHLPYSLSNRIRCLSYVANAARLSPWRGHPDRFFSTIHSDQYWSNQLSGRSTILFFIWLVYHLIGFLRSRHIDFCTCFMYSLCVSEPFVRSGGNIAPGPQPNINLTHTDKVIDRYHADYLLPQGNLAGQDGNK